MGSWRPLLATPVPPLLHTANFSCELFCVADSWLSVYIFTEMWRSTSNPLFDFSEFDTGSQMRSASDLRNPSEATALISSLLITLAQHLQAS